MFDFPASPADGTIYAPPTGPQYQFSGGAWRVASSSVPIKTAETRNRVVNGAMQISQENGNTAGTTNNYYLADQWEANFSTTGTVSYARAAAVTPYGSVYRAALSVSVADTSIAAGEFACFRHKIEGVRIADFQWGTANAKPLVLRFGFIGPAGTYSVAVTNGALNRSYTATFTIPDLVDGYYTIVIPGDTTGTWAKDTSHAMTLYFAVAAGSTVQTAPGSWTAGLFVAATGISNGLAVAGKNFNLYDVGLYLDPQNTGIAPPWTMPDEAQELAACQRYWHKYFSYINSGGNGLAGANTYAHITISPTMRTTPGGSAVNITYSNASGLTSNTINADLWQLRVTVTANGSYYSQADLIFQARL